MNVELLRGTPEPDELICRAARNDYRWDGVSMDIPFEEVMEPVEGDTIDEKKENLIRHCISRGHWGVAEHPSATMYIGGISRACMAQITRHRHASFDVQSLRYVDMEDPDLYWPDSFTSDTAVSRHGEREISASPTSRKKTITGAYNTSIAAYRNLVDSGVPKEDARMVLPIGTKINLTVSMNARAYMHVLNLRGKADAQREIQEVTENVLEELKKWAPITLGVFEEKTPMRQSP